MARDRIRPVILAGGQGARLWPLSQPDLPKQFLNLIGDKSLFQQTVLRLSGPTFYAPIIVCLQGHQSLVETQLQQIGISPQAIVIEPLGRGTASAALVAALVINHHQTKDQLLLIAPSDHVIESKDLFLETIERGVKTAKAGKIVTFGIKPQRVDGQYGYVFVSRNPGKDEDFEQVNGYEVKCFVEKPSLKSAKDYIASGQAYWNSGLFLCGANSFILSGETYLPEVLSFCQQALKRAKQETDKIFLDQKQYQRCQPLSLDHGIMEHSDQLYCYPLSAGWSDLGSWRSLIDHVSSDDAGNTGNGNVVFIDSKGCYAHSVNGTRLTVNGLHDKIVIAVKDNVYVGAKSKIDHMLNAFKQERRQDED